MVRKPNESQARRASGRAGPSGRAASRRFLPRRPPSGTANFGNLFRDPTMVMQELVAEELVRRGFADLRPALLAVGQHVGAHGTRITELAERAQLSKATVVHVVDELERLGYVTREPDPTDGRAKLVRSTPRAREAERAARDAVADIQAAWTEVIGRRDMAALEAALRRLRAALWPEPGDAAA
jgi:DNA-binding MarR family transcriptional regulator